MTGENLFLAGLGAAGIAMILSTCERGAASPFAHGRIGPAAPAFAGAGDAARPPVGGARLWRVHDAPTGWSYPFACCSGNAGRPAGRLRHPPHRRGHPLCRRQAAEGFARRRHALVQRRRGRRQPHHLPVRSAAGGVMAGSPSERLIRDAVADWFREREPAARIVHELKTGQNRIRRADLGVVLPDFLIMVEIKSEKDVLTRLEDQFREFQACSHYALIVAHEKHFDGDVLKGQAWMGWSHREHLWRFPDPGGRDDFRWRFNRYMRHLQPAASRFLELLWAEELRAACANHRIFADTRSQRWQMIRDLQLMLTGDEIRKAVCGELRNRRFAEADVATETDRVKSAETQEAML